jgi:hypothetical protein
VPNRENTVPRTRIVPGQCWTAVADGPPIPTRTPETRESFSGGQHAGSTRDDECPPFTDVQHAGSARDDESPHAVRTVINSPRTGARRSLG